MRIAKNDPRGAHAVIRGELQRASWMLPDVVLRLLSADAHEGDKLLRARFGVGVFESKVPCFPRSMAVWRIAVPEMEERLHLIEIEFDTLRRHGWETPWASRSLGVMVAHHAISRCCHRSVGESNLADNSAVLKSHMLEAARLISAGTVQIGDEITTIDGRGVLMWRAVASFDVPIALRGVTWIADSTLRDPVLREWVVRARDTGTVITHRGE